MMRKSGTRMLIAATAAWFVLFMVPANASPRISQDPSQSGTSERFWIAARYDATQLVTYFETVKFGTPPTRDNQFVQPRTPDFFGPRPIVTDELDRVRPAAGEPFKTGSRYEVLTADGRSVAMTLTSFVKFHTDESIGNQSYIGALGRVATPDLAKLRGNYFVVRRPDSSATVRGTRAGLTEGPIPTRATTAKLLAIVGGDRLVAAQSFTTAAGDARQLVIATAGSGRACRTRIVWLTGSSESRVLGSEEMEFCGGTAYEGLRLRAAVDMGRGRTGLVIVLSGSAGRTVMLVEYQDGAKLEDMRIWQSIGVGD